LPIALCLMCLAIKCRYPCPFRPLPTDFRPMTTADILTPSIGQRWFSPLEPEIGLGIVEELDEQRITLVFEDLEDPRIYSRKAQQISRAVFHVGDTLGVKGGAQFEVTGLRVEQGLIIYSGTDADNNECDVPEILLVSQIAYKSPVERIFAGRWETKGQFKLRRSAGIQRESLLSHKTLGYLGARMEFLPHQISVANRVASAGYRALLADEVGLGKTIEAGMILQRLVIRGDASRILIVTPKALTFQWFVEMMRRFNLHCHIIQDEWLSQGYPLFDLGQQFIISEELFNHQAAMDEFAELKWDVVIVDEFHHYTKEGTPAAWSLLEQHSNSGKPMLGLSATPDEGGQQALYERLQLLAPTHYTDFSNYQSAFANVSSSNHSENDIAILGYGSHHFRNSRANMNGFPERQLSSIACELPEHYDTSTLYPEFADDIETDTRLAELVSIIKANKREKILVITHQADTCTAIEHHLRVQQGFRTADFHENLDLIERDRAAAYFADPEGAQVLICSEIGSEGRNFQFCHKLVMFDLPPRVSQLEQRIGRLDRIGQRNDIELTQLYLEDSPQERLFHLYNEGFDAFLKLDSHNSLLESEHQQAVDDYVKGIGSDSIIDVLASAHRTSLSEDEKALALHSTGNEDEIDDLLDELYERDYHSRETINNCLMDVSQVYNLGVEELGENHFSLSASTHTDEEVIPQLDAEGIEVITDRMIATSNEHLRFFTTEHPWYLELLDRLLTIERGTSWVGKLALKSVPEGTLLLACNYKNAEGKLDQRLWMGTTPLSESITAELLSKSKNVKANMALEWLRSRSDAITQQLDKVKEQLEDDYQLDALGIIICHQ